MESSGLWIAFSILLVVLAVVIGLYIFREFGYRNLINNESKLCLSHNCAYTTTSCGVLPFKVDSDGQLECAPPNIFGDAFGGANIGQTS
jgi:hypothetical protein